MNKVGQQSFLDILLELGQQFSDGGQPGESDAQIGAELVQLILDAVRRSRGVLPGTPEGDATNAETLARMAGWDSDDPELLTAEKAMRRLAIGGRADAVALLKRAASNRQQAASNEQRRRASQPRKRAALAALDDLIERLMRGNPKTSVEDLEKYLRREIGNGVILDMDDTEITLAYGKKGFVKISGLKDRRTRANKRIAKAG
jgi:hypothetical protein